MTLNTSDNIVCSVDSRNFQKVGAIPHHCTKCGGGAKNSGGRLYDKV